jgi:GNAT superfamily N-acetyltransferase
MANKFIVLFLIVMTLNGKAPDSLKLAIQELGMGMQSYSLLAPDGSCVCSLTATQGSYLVIFGSPLFDSMDTSQMPSEVPHLITAVKAIKTSHGLNKVVMVGDLYVSLVHRGKGYAHHLLKETCTHLFRQGFKTIVLIPDPFEYEDGKQKLLPDEDKKQKLVKLYQNCGFKKDNEDKTIFMYHTPDLAD